MFVRNAINSYIARFMEMLIKIAQLEFVRSISLPVFLQGVLQFYSSTVRPVAYSTQIRAKLKMHVSRIYRKGANF